MRSITLPESVLGAKSLPSYARHRRPFTRCFLFSLSSRPKKQNSKPSRPDPSLIFSRYSSSWSANTGQRTARTSDGLVLRWLNYRTCKVYTESKPVMDDCCDLYESLAKNNSRRECHIATDILASNDSFGGIMKFLLVFGFLTLQGSQPALAVSDIASGLPSIPYLGDLGDISTGILADIFLRTRGQDLFYCGASSS